MKTTYKLEIIGHAVYDFATREGAEAFLLNHPEIVAKSKRIDIIKTTVETVAVLYHNGPYSEKYHSGGWVKL